jgi:apolipoprotein N-acyltransferase
MLRRILYWTFTALAAARLLAGGIFDSLHKPAAVGILHTLGYPAYLCSILGTGKLLAVCALLYPRTRLLREWAYAGVTFNMVGASWSHVAVHDTLPATITPVILLVLVIGSYLLRPTAYRLRVADVGATP